jgi:hypothetical protein
MHPTRFFFIPLMIVAAEMQNAMDQKNRQLFIQRSFALLGMAGCRRHSNYYVTKHYRSEGYGVRGEGFSHGKGQHISRTIFAPIPTVETPHSPIPYEQDTQFTRGCPNSGKNRPRQLIQARLVKRHLADMTLHMDRH